MQIRKWLSLQLGVWYWVIIFVIGLILLFLGISSYLFFDSKSSLLNLLNLIPREGVLLIILGLIIDFLVIIKLKRILINPWVEYVNPGAHAASVLLEMKKRKLGPNIVVIGGGTGLSNLLRGLKEYSSNIVAIVSMTDDGKSTGRLRRDLGVLPPGDIRHCLTALSPEERLLTKLFEYRFKKGEGLRGHSFGNLFLTALEKITGGFDKAVSESSKILASQGEVIPSTLENVRLGAIYRNRKEVLGESKIAKYGHGNPIIKIYLNKATQANPKAIKAIKQADFIILGPGSLFTSIIPNLLIKKISIVLAQAQVPKIFICNISTERGETEGFDVQNHVKQLVKYSNDKVITHILVNKKIIRKDESSMLGKIYNISTKKNKIFNYPVIKYDLVNSKNPLYHDHRKLAKCIIKIYQKLT